MRSSRVLMSAAKKGGLPIEMYPLFAAVAVAVGSGCFFTYRHFAFDKELRLWKNANLSGLDDVLNKATEQEKKD